MIRESCVVQIDDAQLVKSPNAKLAVFLNSAGVAAGKAMMTARHNLLEQRISDLHGVEENGSLHTSH